MTRRRQQREFETRAQRGLDWLKVFGSDFGFDPRFIPNVGLDMGDNQTCALSYAFNGHVKQPWDRYNSIIDELQRQFMYSDKMMEKFLVTNGFDLESFNWFELHILRRSNEKKWEALTRAWYSVLFADRAEKAAHPDAH